MKYAFLLKSPLQLLNAVEARCYFGLPADECLLVLMADRKSQGQLLSMLERGESWGGIVSLPAVNLSVDISTFLPGGSLSKMSCRYPLFGKPVFSILKLRRLARRYPDLQTVFVGDQKNSLMRHFANLANAGELVALDDGSATIKYAGERLAGQDDLPARWQKRVGHLLKTFFLGLRDAPPKKLTFFSVYPVALPVTDRLALNEYSDLRRRIAGREVTSEVYFLGGPLVEAGVLSEDDYLWHLLEVQARLAGQRVVYVSHRREQPDRVQRICITLGWQVRLFDFPIEYQLAELGPRPELLASFYSSALENCRLIFDDLLPIVSYRLSRDKILCRNTPKGDGVDMVYEHFERIQSPTFQVIKL